MTIIPPPVLGLTITVHGRPAAQGSKRYLGHRQNAKSGRMSAVLVEQSKRVKPWRALVTEATRQAMARERLTEPLDGPLTAYIVFTVPKPASAPKRRRTWPTTRHSGDLDKLQRAAFDGIADAGAVVDDSRIIRVTAMKVFPGEHPHALNEPGAYIHIAPEIPTMELVTNTNPGIARVEELEDVIARLTAENDALTLGNMQLAEMNALLADRLNAETGDNR